MQPTELEIKPPEAEPKQVDRAAIKRRRRLLFAFAGLALLAVVGFAVVQFVDGKNSKTHAAKTVLKPPVILERFELNPVGGQSGHGLAELVRNNGGAEGLRVLAVKLRPTLDGEVYQLLLAGGGKQPKLLGNEVVGSNRAFVGEAKVGAEQLHSYRRIDLQRVGQGNPPTTKLILRGLIPR